MTAPQKAAALVRLSDGRRRSGKSADVTDEITQGLDRQREQLQRFADGIGWKITEFVIENDLRKDGRRSYSASAYARHKVTLPNGRTVMRTRRPAFNKILDGLWDGRFDGLVLIDLDRAVRNHVDLTNLLDVVEMRKLNVRSKSGSLDLTNGGSEEERTKAWDRVGQARKASVDTGRRVADARKFNAEQGQYGGGRRPYGFDHDGVTVRPGEADVIADASYRVLQGESLRSLAADLRGRVEQLPAGFIGPPRHLAPTVTGAQWTAQTLREILLRPRNAGIMVYQGEEIGTAPWAPIVPVDTLRGVVAKLTDPDRHVGPGGPAKYLGSGIFRCGICNDGTTVNVRLAGRAPAYRCSKRAHLVRNVAQVDAHVLPILFDRLSTLKPSDVMCSPDIDVTALRAEAAGIGERLAEMGRDRADGLITRSSLIAATKRSNARLAEIDDQLESTVDSVLASVVGVPVATIRERWARMELGTQRAVLAKALRVVILPSGRQGRGFDPTTVLVLAA